MRTTAKSFQSGWKFLTRTMMTELKWIQQDPQIGMSIQSVSLVVSISRYLLIPIDINILKTNKKSSK